MWHASTTFLQNLEAETTGNKDLHFYQALLFFLHLGNQDYEIHTGSKLYLQYYFWYKTEYQCWNEKIVKICIDGWKKTGKGDKS